MVQTDHGADTCENIPFPSFAVGNYNIDGTMMVKLSNLTCVVIVLTTSKKNNRHASVLKKFKLFTEFIERFKVERLQYPDRQCGLDIYYTMC